MILVGILTYFASINNGAFLQTYALQETLKRKYGEWIDVEIINYDTKISHDLYRDAHIGDDCCEEMATQYQKFLEARNFLQLSAEKLVSDDVDEVKRFLQGKYDIIIVGSDEVWRTNSIRKFPNAYWLNFKLENTIYMAYAISGRSEYNKLTEEYKKYIQESVERFSYIGIRDAYTKEELSKICNKKTERNCDPTFLAADLFKIKDCEKSIIKKKYNLSNNSPIVVLMITNKSIGLILYRMLRRSFQVIYVFCENEDVQEKNWMELSPFEWVEVLGIADYIVTDFFHGTIFSILHNIPFLSIDNEQVAKGKIWNLLYENSLEDRIICRQKYSSNQEIAMAVFTRINRELEERPIIPYQNVVEAECTKAESFFEALEKEIKKRV